MVVAPEYERVPDPRVQRNTGETGERVELGVKEQAMIFTHQVPWHSPGPPINDCNEHGSALNFPI